MTRLWCITYEVLDGDPCNVFVVAVDMDEQSAEMEAVKDYKSNFAIEGTDDENLSDEHFLGDLGNVYFEAVPEEIDGWHVVLAEEVGSI